MTVPPDPTPTPEAAEARLAAIRERSNAALASSGHIRDMVAWHDSASDVPYLLAEVARLTAERDALRASVNDTCDLVGVVSTERDRLREALEMAYTVLKDDPAAQFTARLVRVALAGPHAADAGADPTPGASG